jgi:hypothetical protein
MHLEYSSSVIAFMTLAAGIVAGELLAWAR